MRPSFPLVLLSACALLTPLAAVPGETDARLRVVTYNVRMGEFFTKLLRPMIRRSFTRRSGLKGAHIFALQEVCINKAREREFFEEIVRSTHGVAYSHGETAEPGPGGSKCDVGQLIVSPYPILASGKVQFPKVGKYRSAAWADLAVSGPGYDRIRVYSLHLSNRKGKQYAPIEGRWRQARLVLDHLAEFKREFPTAPVIVAGDFNALGHIYDPWVREKTIREFSKVLDPTLRGFKITALIPYMIDWIFQDGLKLVGSRVEHVIYSDHFPVVADFEPSGQ